MAAADFDALVIPGGYAPDRLRRSETVLDLVRAFDDASKPIAFICHAGWVPFHVVSYDDVFHDHEGFSVLCHIKSFSIMET